MIELHAHVLPGSGNGPPDLGGALALEVCAGGEPAPSRVPDLDAGALDAITLGQVDCLLLGCPFGRGQAPALVDVALLRAGLARRSSST